MRRQHAVWWKRLQADDYGRYSYASPVAIKCRWDENVGQTMSAKGDMVASSSTVYVDRVMSVGDKLKLGEIDSNTSTDPREDPLAFEIMSFEQNPNFRNTQSLLTAHL